MKKILIAATAGLAFASACTVQKVNREVANVDAENPSVLTDFMDGSKPFELTDISKVGLSSQRLWNEMKLTSTQLQMKNGASICANRAHTWAYDIYRNHKINTGKIIIYFGSGLFPEDNKQWWYHIAPYVIENGKEVVLDGGFSRIKGPISADEWIQEFGKGNKCKVLTKDDKRYNEMTRTGKGLPGTGYDKEGNPRGGEAMCYIRRVPMEYWTPLSVFIHEFKRNYKNEPIIGEFDGTDFDAVSGDKTNDVMMACREAVTSNVGDPFRKGLKRCQRHFGFRNLAETAE